MRREKRMKKVYLDNNATTQIAPEVMNEMVNAMNLYGNASSMHSSGREAMIAIENAREYVGSILGVDSEDILFTSGGSESDNNVLYTAATLIDKGSKRDRIIVSTIEHPAIIETCKDLTEKGYKVEYVPVDSFGVVLPESLKKMMSDDVLLVSVMSANNETGTIQPIKEINSNCSCIRCPYAYRCCPSHWQNGC